MSMSSRVKRGLCTCAVAAVAACAGGDAPPSPDTQAHLAVAGRSNANASMAAADSLVVVAWSASTSDTTDVFIGVSRDGGKSFAHPVRVNAIPGDARINSEFPPRVVIVPK